MAESVGEKSGKLKKLTPEERGSIIALAREGYSINDIATQLDKPVKQVSGIVNTAKNRGDLLRVPPPRPDPTPPSTEAAAPTFVPAPASPEIVTPSPAFLPPEESMNQPAAQPTIQNPVAPAPAAPPVQAVAAPAPSVVQLQPPPYQGIPSQPADSYNWRSSTPGNSQAGFSFSTNQIRYLVERIVPADGILGTHPHPFEPIDIARHYGSGTYKVTRQEPGRPPAVSDQFTIARSFGEPRFGQQESRGGEIRRPPFRGGYERNDRGGDLSEDDGGTIRIAPRPGYDRYAEPGRAPAAPAAIDNVATEAVKAMGRIQEQQVKENAELRKSGPDNWMQQYLMSQQKQWEEQRERENARREEERHHADERREEDRKREELRREDEKKREDARLAEERRRDDLRLSEERRRAEEKAKDDQRSYERRMDEEEKKHLREMDRLKQEAESRARFEAEQRQTILGLEQKKIEIIQTEAKAREEIMKKEIERNREDFNRVTQEMTTQMSELEKGVTSQLERERDQLRREFDIKNKALDNEHALRTEMLRLREETSSRGEGEAFTKMIEKIVTEVGKNVKEVVELKKLEVMSPEAQAAAVHRATDANILTNPNTQAKSQQLAPSATQPAAVEEEIEAEPTALPTGLAGSEGGKVDDIVRAQLKEGVPQELLKEWVMHVGAQSPPQMLVNMFVQYMRSENEKQAQACTTFATYITPRNWEQMYEVLEPVVTADQLKVLQTEYADEFYECFRALVVEAVREYWEMFAVAREQQREQRKANAPQVQAAPAPAPAGKGASA